MANGTGFRHLTLDDRKYIEKVYKFRSAKRMAEDLGVSWSAINRELNRCERGNYTAKAAQMDADQKLEKRIIISRETRERKQVEAVLRLQPTASVEGIVKATRIRPRYVKKYYNEVRKAVLTE